MSAPPVRYARNGEVSIAYATWGDGPVPLVGVPGIVHNIETIWEQPEARAWLERLGTFARAVFYDKRGQGLSEREAGVPTLDERLGDLAAVMNAAGLYRAALLGISEGGSTAAMFAASAPERVSHLVLIGTFARPERERGDEGVPAWAETWATPETWSVGLLAPSRSGDPDFLAWVNKLERQTTTPRGLIASWDWVRDIDVTPVLGSIQCPALVVHKRGDQLVPVELGRELAAGIPGARLVELDGADHFPWFGEQARMLGEIEEFLTGRPAPAVPASRILATVMLTDIVGSTATAARLGDRRWTELLGRHTEISRTTVGRHGGRWVKDTGDGVLATFDAPGRALDCAAELRRALDGAGLPIRAGLHTGEIEARGEDIGGLGVHIAARVEELAGAGEVLVSRTVKDLVAGSGHRFDPRGEHELKGVPERWPLYALASAESLPGQ